MKTKTNKTIKKILSIALCLALVMSYVPMVGVTAKALSDGVTDASIYDGDRDGRYEIGSSEQLTVFANLVNGGNTTLKVELVSDVVFDGETPWVPIGSIYDPFEGIFDGQFYTISGLYINDTTMKNVGLFGTIAASGRVKNVGVINSKFITTRRGDGYSAGGVAVLNRGRIEQCYVENTTIQANGAGGIVSVNQGYINNCYTDATIKGNFAGGIADSNFGCIYASIGTSSVTGDTLRGSLVATNYERNAESTGSGYSLISSYGVSGDAFGKFYGSKDDVSGAVSSSKMASGEIAYDLQSCSSAWGQALGVDEHPVFGAPKVYYSQSANSYSNYEPAVYNDSGIYEIAKAENFMWFAEQMNKGNLGSSVNAILTDDIDLTGYSWKPIGNASTKYKGVFDGQGHTISNFNMTITGAGNWGLFGYATGEGTVIKNFSISGDVTTALTSNVDVQYGVVGQADGTAEIRNVHSSVNLTSNDTYQKKYFGGIVGRTGNITVDSCSFSGKLSLGSNTLDCVGGIVGYVYNGKTAKITNCGFYGDIDTTYSGGNVGGILGYYNGENAKALTVSNCLSVGTLPEGRGAIVGTLKNYGSTNAGSNNYYLDGVTNTVTNVTAAVATQTQLASGEIAIALGDAWGQMSNTEGSLPIITDNELYKVVTVGETGNYSVANVGDTNGDGTVDVNDYQVLVNAILNEDPEQEAVKQIETASYDDIVKYDLDGDGYLDVIDASLMALFINGLRTVDVYAVGDYDLNGKAFEEADIKAIKHAIENPEKLATYKKYASDINGDGKLDENDLTALTAKYGEVTGTECADNVEVYYRWGNKYSTCTATAMCTLCGKKVAVETVNTTSETLSELTCTQDGKVKYTATFKNELLGTKSIEIVSKAEGHKYIDGVCAVCGLTMTAEELKAVVAQQLAAGETDIEVTLAPDAPAEIITAIRRAICDTEGVADGSIHLTLGGVTTIPGTTNWDGVAFGPGDIYDEAGKIVDQELVTQLASINLPDVTEIGAQAFYFCENLVSVSAPKAQTIGAQALGYTALTSVEFPELTTIPTDMFSGTWTLSSAKFPKVTTIEQGGLLVGAKFWPENNPTPFPLELTAEGDITFNGSYHFNIAERNYTGKVDLVLCCDKKDAVTFHVDGTATWQVRDDLSYTFKSITFKHSYVNGKCTACGEDCAHTGEATYTLTEDGKQHIAKWSCCDTEVTEDHTGGTATCKEPAKCEHCDASYGELDPNNHEYEKNNGICCETYQPAELNESGYYEIGNAGQLFWFAQQVNVEGNKEIKGALTADIHLENKPWTPIGAMGEENSFRGVFDGQNYTIRGLNVEGSENGVGFFGEVRTGTVKNFTIYGEVIVNTEVDYVGGVIGSICGLDSENDLERNGAVIQNITSYVKVTAKAHGIGMIGGFVGYADHQSLIEKCSWYGTFNAGEYRVDDGAGGFIGKIQGNTSEVTIRNCAAYGTIKTDYVKNSYNNNATIYMGGFLSFSNTNAKTTLENCLFAGRFERGANLTDEARLGAFGTLRSVNAIKNCYYLGDDGLAAVHSDSLLNPGSDNVEITSVTEDDLRNGTVATQLGNYWEQGEHYPVIKK